MQRTEPITVTSPATKSWQVVQERLAGRVRSRTRLVVTRLVVSAIDRVLAVMRGYNAFLWMVSSAPPSLLATVGRWRATRTAQSALRRVPAYREFAAEHDLSPTDVATLRLPETDKDSYVSRFGLVERCFDGRLPSSGVAIDESSGSTGTPFNWIRSLDERETSRLLIGQFARYLFGSEPLVTINAFSLGAWATGLNMGIAFEQNGIVKNTGPDTEKILKTLEFLGRDQRYLICGYPPFLKHLMDYADDCGFPLEDYSLRALVGGEGMSEGLRDYLSSRFSPIYSGYGATDIEIGLGGETPLTVAIRRAARTNTELRRTLFGDDPRLPMLFQYNPLSHYVTVNAEGELVFTITRLEVLSPRVAYNIHDEGGITSFSEMDRSCRSVGLEMRRLPGLEGQRHLKLPFLWVYGRKDSTVSVMGANIYPEDIEQALYEEPTLAAVTHSFCLGLEEESSGTVRPSFSFELRVDASDGLQRAFDERITRRVLAMNTDYRVAMEEYEAQVRPLVKLYPLGSGPFARDRSRIKQTRIVPPAAH